MEPKKIFLYEVSMTFQMMLGGGIVAAIGRDMRVPLFFNHSQNVFVRSQNFRSFSM